MADGARPPTLADYNPRRPFKPATVKQAVQMQTNAAVKRAIGQALIEEHNDRTGGRFEIAEAESMEKLAAEFLDVGSHVTGPHEIGNGGELVVRTQEAMGSIPGVIDTLRDSPGMLSASASRDRLELTGNALTLAVDAAESIKPKNSLEKMLAHQLAASHRLAMQMVEQSSRLVNHHEALGPINQAKSVEAARLANAAARMMGAFQDGLMALEKIRRGGKQTVKVIHQHVAVGPGGQAVVTGSMKAGGRKTRGRTGK